MRFSRLHPHLDCLLQHKGGVFLYAISLPGDVVKIGFTRQPRERVLQFERLLGFRASRFDFQRLPEGVRGWVREREAIAAAHAVCPPCQGREYFDQLSFEQAARIVADAAKPAPRTKSPKPTPQEA